MCVHLYSLCQCFTSPHVAGDGKTHYIKRQLKQHPSSCTISVNEAFTPLGAIKKLRRLPYDKPDCAIFFNFTLLPPGGKNFPLHNLNEVSQQISACQHCSRKYKASTNKMYWQSKCCMCFHSHCAYEDEWLHVQIQSCVFSHQNISSEDKHTAEHTLYRRLIEVIGWFFFDLLILGYVEDRDTGLSFRLPGGLDWVIYVEVPSRDLTMTPEEMLEQFCGDIPTLGLLGSPHKILNEIHFIIDEEVQLVCKYLKAYKEKRIDRLYKERGMLYWHNSTREYTFYITGSVVFYIIGMQLCICVIIATVLMKMNSDMFGGKKQCERAQTVWNYGCFSLQNTACLKHRISFRISPNLVFIQRGPGSIQGQCSFNM